MVETRRKILEVAGDLARRNSEDSASRSEASNSALYPDHPITTNLKSL
jgi:hypothetical protein